MNLRHGLVYAGGNSIPTRPVPGRTGRDIACIRGCVIRSGETFYVNENRHPVCERHSGRRVRHVVITGRNGKPQRKVG